MKKLLIFFLFLIGCEKIDYAAIYYVAIPANGGNDGNVGSLASPWATWQKAFTTVVAGDIVYIRGGVYYSGTGSTGVSISSKNGTAGNRITISNYNNEVPIFDCSTMTGSGNRRGIDISDCDYWNFTGLTVRNVTEYNLTEFCDGWFVNNCNYLNFNRVNIYSCGNGWAVVGDDDYIDWTNCDSYDNADWSDNGGYANGWTITLYKSGATFGTGHFTLTGCRAWGNSDDGFDQFGANGYMTFTDCWAFDNGWGGGGSGNGDGFKARYHDAPELGVQRSYIRCLAWNNRDQGFTAERHGDATHGIQHFYNCVAWKNGTNGFAANVARSGEPPHVFKNNISFDNSTQYAGYAGQVEDHNSWDTGFSVSVLDFVTLDDTGADGDRDTDGDLPIINFFRPASDKGNNIVDNGVDVGLSYYGSAPDLGAYEFLGEEIIIPPSEPGVFGILKAWVGGKWVFVKQGNNLVYMTGTSVPNPPTYDYTISGQTYVNTNSSWPGVVIPNTSKVTLGFLNNSITSQNIDGYQLDAGDENAGATNNNLDGAVITGNKITWVGSPVGVSGVHGVMLGYNINQIVKYNYLDNNPYGVVFKSDDNMTDVSGVLAYNIFHDGYLNVRVKGFNGVKIYNNTFYSTGTYPLIFIDGNPTISTGTKIKNNIFYLPSGGFAVYLANGSESGFECDYNLYYCAGSNPNFYYQGSSKTWAEWRALGYDANSVVVNPNFINTTALVPTVRLNYGTNLGVTYQTGLSTAATWVVGTSPGTKNQDAIWQVGARIY